MPSGVFSPTARHITRRLERAISSVPVVATSSVPIISSIANTAISQDRKVSECSRPTACHLGFIGELSSNPSVPLAVRAKVISTALVPGL